MTRDQLARFIVQVIEGSHTLADWQRIAVNHYQDEKMEEARIELVRYVSGYTVSPEGSDFDAKRRLIAISEDLTQ